jgi:hypothetical protein
MTPPADPERYKNHRFPGEIISHGVWLYYRFPLSYRDVQELLFERGIDVTHEAIRQRRVNASIACRGLSRRGTPSAFCPRMASLPTTFVRDGIGCRRRRIVQR